MAEKFAKNTNPANYNTTPATRVDGEPSALEVDQKGNLKGTLETVLTKDNDSVLAFPKGCNLAVISKTTAVTIGGGVAGDTKLRGIYVIAALVGTCAVTGFADSDGTAQTFTLPAGTSAGFLNFKGAKNSAGALTVTCSNAADDNDVIVLWEPNTDTE